MRIIPDKAKHTAEVLHCWAHHAMSFLQMKTADLFYGDACLGTGHLAPQLRNHIRNYADRRAVGGHIV